MEIFKKKRNLHAIFFDLGNTLIDFYYGASQTQKEESGIASMTEYLQQFSQSITPTDVKTYFLQPLNSIKEKRIRTEKEFAVEDYLDIILRRFDIHLSKAQKIPLLQSYFQPGIRTMKFHPKLTSLFQDISRHDIDIGIISNTYIYSDILKAICQDIGLHQYISEYFFSIDTEWKKPHPEIFQIALKSFQVKPAHALMIGDNLRTDIIPAAKFGMHTIWLKKRDTINGTIPKSTQIIHNIMEVSEILQF